MKTKKIKKKHMILQNEGHIFQIKCILMLVSKDQEFIEIAKNTQERVNLASLLQRN